MIQYQILRANIIRVVLQTVRRINNEILDVKGLRETLKYRGIPNKKLFFLVDFLAFVTHSVLLILCFLFYFWYNRKRKVTVTEIQFKKKSVHIVIKRWWSVNKVTFSLTVNQRLGN